MSLNVPSAPGDSILELRKEKSRDAARSRRGKENYEFYELAKLLPLPAAITSQLDKASIIRLSISYLKLQEFSAHGDPPWTREYNSTNGKTVKGQGRRRNANIVMDLFENHQGTHILQSLDGFAFALSNDGRFLYISETVSIYLGLSQVEVTGSSIFDYVHIQDHQELAEQLGIGFPYSSPGSVPSPNTPSDDGSQPSTPRVVTPPSPEKSSLMISSPERGSQRTFCMRMKSTLTKRGVHVRTSGYRVVYVVGHIRPQICFSLNRKQPQQILGMVGVAIALPPPTVTELRIESDTFILRLSPALRVLYCDTAISEITDWSCDDINNKALYDFCHPADLNKLRKSHLDITTKGQVLSEFFRLINKCGGYVWVQMCGTTLFSSKTSDDHTILAIIYVLSGVEYRGCVMDTGQLTITQHTETDHSDNTDQSEQGSDHGGNSKDDVTRNSKSPGDCDDRDSSGMMGVSPQPCDVLKHSVSQIEGDRKGDCHSLPNQDKDFIPSNNNSMQADILYSRTCVQGETTTPIISNSQGKISAFKNDFKYSRRKTDRPRKRRREFEVECCTEDEIPSSSTSARLEADTCGNCNDTGCDITCQSSTSRHRSNGRLSASNSPDSSNYVSTLPEDLSLNSFPIRQVSVSSSTSAVSSCESRMQTSCWQNGSTKDREHNSGASSSTSSVKDLEDVMNKHLPHISSHIETGLKGSSDLTARHLSPGNMQKSRSTVQWRGTASDNDPLPASNLLRTLYANRESVIRSNTRPQCFNGDNSNSGVGSVDMLTPPGSDGGLKEQLTLNIPQITVSGKTVSAYNNPLSVSVHNSVPDTFNITPPSSVSPEDKGTAPFVDGNYNPASCNLTPTNSLANPVPVKSQTFSISLPTQISTMPDYSMCSNKINYSNMAAYNMADYQQYAHSGSQGSVIMYDSRPESWYPVSYPS